ncbi:hypothetical protein PHISCL_06642 [Aspergillus sclerotialis]|uniref:Uncharacterized protein n=1 Tax=Aspergillus sclerotialis TaxID=2070753 RepID=A0A3A2ZVG7_9EURO|nr:hypothetical protein PHISCL_06642 [Aspergillus sclerotialis]
MSPTLPPKEGSTLGESWVVASSLLEKDKSNKESKRKPASEENSAAESMTTSASSVSGPELIMPSIYEMPISETSWVAPEMRSKGQSSPKSLKRRHKTSSPKDRTKEKPKTRKQDEHVVAQETETHQEDGIIRRVLNTVQNERVSLIRLAINIVLFLAIAHLLVLPELVSQHQSLCSIKSISRLYPISCVPPHPEPQTNLPSRYETVISSQTQLESLFNATLREMKPLTSTLKQSETLLHDMQKKLKSAYPGTRHELDLEFEGCWQAIRAATKKFDNLNADMQSAVDSLLATGALNTQSTQSRPSSWPSQLDVAKNARFSTQMLRRKQYLDQLTSRMRSKTDSLSADLAALDDHLESIENTVNRQRKQTVAPDSLGGHYFSSFLSVLPDRVGSFFQPPGQNSPPTPSPEQALLKMFQDAVVHHRPVVDMVGNLSSRLQGLQRLKGV